MKQILFILACTLISVSSNAKVETTIDGVKYSLDDETKTASVVQNHYQKKTYDIPSSILYDDVTYTVTSIGDRAFYYREGLGSITLPNTIETIGDEAFYNCISLSSINIPNSVTSIGSGAFNWCQGLQWVNMSKNVTYIGENAFRACTSLTSIEIPSSVTTIGSAAFQN
jgi:hypothetical protein